MITAALQMTLKCVSVIFRRLFSELPTATFKIKFLENKTAALLLIIASGITFFLFFLNIYFFFFLFFFFGISATVVYLQQLFL